MRSKWARRLRARTIGLTAAALAGLLSVTMVTPAGAGTSSGSFRIRLRVQALQPLDGAFYELWIVKGDVKLSAGAFNIAEDGTLVDLSGRRARFLSNRNPALADSLVVTIEPLPDPDPGPSAIAVLAGAPTRTGAALEFPIDLGSIAGSFILATPTDSDTTNETSGIWFLDPAAGPGPSLTLPTLPGGWVFEGWGVTQDVPLTTGKFTSASGADMFSGFSGPLAGPPFPGEDFLTNLPAGVTPPVNLADGSSAAVVTLEPDLGGTDPTGPGPFSIKPLVGEIASGAPAGTSIPLVRDLSSVPSGEARF